MITLGSQLNLLMSIVHLEPRETMNKVNDVALIVLPLINMYNLFTPYRVRNYFFLEILYTSLDLMFIGFCHKSIISDKNQFPHADSNHYH